jgi:putative salt-induced outer membrane protein
MSQSRSNNCVWPGLLAMLGLLFTAAPSYAADNLVFHLRNGDRITGRVVSEDIHQVTVFTVWKQDLVIPIDEITKREKAEGRPIVASPMPPIKKDEAKPSEKTAPAAATAVKPKPSNVWHGDIQVGTDLAFSERNRQLYYARAKITHTYERLKNTLDFNAAYGRTEGVTSDNRAEGSLKTDYDYGQKAYVYNLGGMGYDTIRKIDLHYEIGPGLGYHVIKRSNWTWNIEGGANYQARSFSDNTTDDKFFLRAAEDGSWKISNKLTFDEKLEFFPNTEDLRQYRIRFESNLRYWLLENLSFNLTLLDVYDTTPAAGVSQNDLQIRSSVGVKF